jgi:O-antigen ligase
MRMNHPYSSTSMPATGLQLFRKWDTWIWAGLMLFVLFIPIAKPPSTFGELIAIAAWLPGWWHSDTRAMRLQRYKNRPLLFAFPLFFILHLIGLIWTEDLSQGFHEINMAHYLIVLPMIIGSLEIQRRHVFVAIGCFLLSNLVAGVLTIYIRQMDHPLLNAELYLPSPFISRPRASLFYAFSLLLWLELPFHISLNHRFKQIIWLICTGIMLMALFNLEGRTGQIAFAVVLPIWLVLRFIKRHRAVWFGVFLTGSTVLGWLSYTYIGNIHRRFTEAIEEVEAYRNGFQDRNANDTSLARRFIFWEKSWVVFTTSPIWGVGTGDLNASVEPLFLSDSRGVSPNKPHNQFLEYGVKFGIVGLVVFLFGWWHYVKGAHRKYRIIAYCLSALCLVSMLSESTLDTQAGISFFVFFLFLLYHSGTELE